MTLDLHDIQGNIVKAYPRLGYPRARYIFFRIRRAEAGRIFLKKLIPHVTDGAPWHPDARGPSIKPPTVTLNVAFTFHGLRRLGLPQASLQTFPEEFAMGMRPRCTILDDSGRSAPDEWDPVWREHFMPDIFVTLNGPKRMEPLEDGSKRTEPLEEKYEWLMNQLKSPKVKGGVEIAVGHRGPDGREDLPYQDASAIMVKGKPTPKEHFGYTDGISNPYFKGAGTNPLNVIGGGKVTGGDVETRAGWEPLATGEFLLGHKDEAFEYPSGPLPHPLATNGTYLVYRKLHQNVDSFDRYLKNQGAKFPGGEEALAAKFAGRWRNGAPLTTFPTEKDANKVAKEWAEAMKAMDTAKNPTDKDKAKVEYSKVFRKLVAFDYRKDPDGYGCPVGAHTRRAHPRAALEFGVKDAFATPDALSNRRRIIRRGLPYGDSKEERKDDGNHGIIFMALNASIRRQFEFVQQQWIEYGNDFRLGNDKDPLLGNHGTAGKIGRGRMLIPNGPDDPKPPHFCSGIPQFVETRGGDYYFVPSLTALRMIAEGIVDPT